MLYHEFSASTTPRKTKASYESYDWLQIRILSKHNKNSTNFLNIKFGTHFIMWYPVLLSFLVFLSQYCVPYLCQPKKSLTSKPQSQIQLAPWGAYPFNARPEPTLAVSTCQPRGNINRIKCQLGLSSKDWIHKSYAHLRKLDRTSTKPNSSTVFWSLFSLIKPQGCYTLPRLILNKLYIYSKSYSPQDPCMAI